MEGTSCPRATWPAPRLNRKTVRKLRLPKRQLRCHVGIWRGTTRFEDRRPLANQRLESTSFNTTRRSTKRLRRLGKKNYWVVVTENDLLPGRIKISRAIEAFPKAPARNNTPQSSKTASFRR